jgi:methyltransferase (TIGR00027 family)
MDARAYRLRSLKGCSVFEVDSAKALHLKESILLAMVEAGEPLPRLKAKSLQRVASDIATEDWFGRLTAAGFKVRLPTVWILEGFLYYLHEAHAKETLRCISGHSMSETVVLADFMNESSTHLAHELQTHFYFHSDWPEELLPKLGFPHVTVSQIGDPDANFGLINDELNLFHQTRRVSRHVKADGNGNPYRRLLLVETSAS